MLESHGVTVPPARVGSTAQIFQDEDLDNYESVMKKALGKTVQEEEITPIPSFFVRCSVGGGIYRVPTSIAEQLQQAAGEDGGGQQQPKGGKGEGPGEGPDEESGSDAGKNDEEEEEEEEQQLGARASPRRPVVSREAAPATPSSPNSTRRLLNSTAGPSGSLVKAAWNASSRTVSSYTAMSSGGSRPVTREGEIRRLVEMSLQKATPGSQRSTLIRERYGGAAEAHPAVSPENHPTPHPN